MSYAERKKLQILAEIEGYDYADELIEACIVDSVAPGICKNQRCDYTCEVEPDQDAGYCEECDSQTVVSALVLAEMI